MSVAREAAPSRLAGRVIFVLGPPGSGAEALAEAIARVPGAVRAGVDELFSKGMPQLVGNYFMGEVIGLGPALDDGEFLATARSLADDLLDPSGTGPLIVDASPGQADWVEVIAFLYPDATFVQLVRPPREVISEAGRWRPRAALAAARGWRRAHRCLLDAVDEPRFPAIAPATLERTVVSVTDLRRDPRREIERVLALAGSDATAADVAAASAALRVPEAPPSSPLARGLGRYARRGLPGELRG